MKDIFLFGGGYHPNSVLEAIEKEGRYRVCGFVDWLDPLCSGKSFGVERISKEKFLESKIRSGVVAINTNFMRAQLVEEIIRECADFEFLTVIHPSAEIARGVEISRGTVVLAGAILGADTKLGEHVIVNTRASIDHDCKVGNFASVLPGSTVCGQVEIGDYSAICAGAIVIHKRKIGAHTVIGAGSTVVTDIPEQVVAVGNPCRVIRSRAKDQRYLN